MASRRGWRRRAVWSFLNNAMAIAPGTIIADRYEVIGPLGQGGMGEVVVAKHLFLKQNVALKLIRSDARPDGDVLKRFEREAHIIARLRGENIARVLDAGQTEYGMPFIAMELLTGEDLDSIARKTGKLPVDVAVRFVMQACEGLAEAHVMGIVHRDLKPANLFLTTKLDGTKLIKILDFGISKVAPGVLSDSSGAQVTGTTTTIGSPAFMSPEQLRSSRDVDLRTDIWALGVILFRLCSGRFPFEGDTITEVIVKAMTESPLDLQSLEPSLPKQLIEAVDACLQKNRDHRPINVGALARMLAPILEEEGDGYADRISRILGKDIANDPTVASGDRSNVRAAILTAESSSRSARPEPRKSYKRTLHLAAAAGGLVVLSLVLWLLRSASSQTVSVSPQATTRDATVSEKRPAHSPTTPQEAPRPDAAEVSPALMKPKPVIIRNRKKSPAPTSANQDDLFDNRR
ncbi:MAG: serine/threonine-protein kinase [Deltaproteobacteria bacterium]|nr:serine/threonine-protein kinase [Deltaproteobacteria bacterium]